MAIRYVKFIDPVSLGSHGSVAGWSEEKHGRQITAAEKGNWLVLVFVNGPEAKVAGQRRRVPLTNVSYINDDDGPTLFLPDGNLRPVPKEPAP